MKFPVRHHCAGITVQDIRENSRLADGALFIVDVPDDLTFTFFEKHEWVNTICAIAFTMQNDNETHKIVEDYPSMSYGDIVIITTIHGRTDYMFCDSIGWKEVNYDFYRRWRSLDSYFDRQKLVF